MRKINEAMSCRCKSGTLVREVTLTDDGFLLDNPDWSCTGCGRVVREHDPGRVAPWPDPQPEPEPETRPEPGARHVPKPRRVPVSASASGR
jgi:hypothetical protein